MVSHIKVVLIVLAQEMERPCKLSLVKTGQTREQGREETPGIRTGGCQSWKDSSVISIKQSKRENMEMTSIEKKSLDLRKEKIKENLSSYFTGEL